MQQEEPKESEVKGQEPTRDSETETATEIEIAGSEEQEQEPNEEQVLEGQVAEWKELAMRATADLDNFRKRMAREKSEALRYGNQALLEELLPVLDNFEIGLQAAAAEEDSMIVRGMEMVKKQLDEFLAGQGVAEVPADGEVFDPNVHEAVTQEECPETDEGRVLRVIRRGYKMHDRLLRPANVVVAKRPDEGGSTAEEHDAATAGEGNE